jgi:hypothetical protein
MPTNALRCLPPLLILLVWSEAALADWYAKHRARPPSGSKIYVCHGYTCRTVTPVSLSAEEVRRIAKPLHGTRDAAGERQALSGVVQAYERMIGRRVGTSNDLPATQVGSARRDQMDCIDEATNTTSLLTLLGERGLLKHHRVEAPAARGFFLDGRYPHATAVLAEAATGEKWAVDSWPNANAEPPVIQRLSEWYRDRGGSRS